MEMFAPLKNTALFKAVQVEKGGYAVYWNSEIDISEYELWRNGQVVSWADKGAALIIFWPTICRSFGLLMIRTRLCPCIEYSVLNTCLGILVLSIVLCEHRV